MSKNLAIIAGVGPGTGRSLAVRFASAYTVILLSRSPANFTPIVEEINASNKGGKEEEAIGIPTDLTDKVSVQNAFQTIKERYPGRELAAAVYNSGSMVRKPFLELTEEDFTGAFKSQAGAAFTFSQHTLPLLLQSTHLSPPPTLLFTGATASVKGSANFAAFASGKFALRALAQSLAREFGPKGVHVGHVIVDGVIDTPKAKGWDFGAGGKLEPDAIAESYWHLHQQPKTSFTFELDVRPSIEKW